MAENQTQKSDIRDYLLGNISTPNEDFEEKLMTDDDFFQEFLIAEEELVEEYVDGDLTGSEKQKFEEFFLISDDRREKVEFARSLGKHIDRIENAKKTESALDKGEKPNFFESLKGFFSSPLPVAICLLIIAGLVWGLFFYGSNENSLSPLEQEYAELNNKDFNNVKDYDKSSRLNLITGTTRSSENFGTLSEKELTEKVFFRLALPAKTEEIIKVELLKQDEVIFSQNGLKIYTNETGEEIRFLLPANILKKGDYQIRVTTGESQSAELIYSFSVE